MVEGTSPAARGSITTAARSARARPLKQDSAIWWLFSPYRVSTWRVHAGIHGEGMKPFAHELGIELADLVAGEIDLEHQDRPARDVDHDARQRLVHGQVDVGIAGDAGHAAERLLDGLPQRNTGVLGGMMMINVQVAHRLDREVDAGMTGEEIEHMVEKADAGRDVGRAGAIEVHSHLDVGLFGLALDRRGAHWST